MLEIEQKFANADHLRLERCLQDWGATVREVEEEVDHYLNAPDRDFARTDEAFRLRRIGEANYLTYKGPKAGGPVKTRTELEVTLPEGAEAAGQFLQIFRHLGYRSVALVRKRRRSFALRRGGFDLLVCLDEVEGLGSFAEVEIMAAEEEKERAQGVLQETTAALGLSGPEPRSYLEMILRQAAKQA